ncbi:hypothetical protein BGZ61DRAFT_593960 [Ilyonectria robusta]|uniref:uncharacterized protein n=1 Tax=Ilyonectria robusta TaxID=1079257 RepID=UPI001E8ED634|nr:uncharacterized protein BGZ61DRAFT_593960 [Ilyonectria robusta]KAH8659555.1 hypothetical protein BGZ61DRAFT_593960 [Ilyonectria robusta]
MSQPSFEKGSPPADPPPSPPNLDERYPPLDSPPSLTPDREETDNPSVTLPQPGVPAYAPVSPVTPPLPPSDYTPIAFAYVHPSVNPNYTTNTADPPRRAPRRKLPNGPRPGPRSGVKPVSGWKPASGLKSKPTAVIESMIASASQSTSTTFVKSESVDVVMSEKTPEPTPVAEKAPIAEPTPIAQPIPIAPGTTPAFIKQESTQDANEGLLNATATELNVLNGPAPNLQPVANPENFPVNHDEASSVAENVAAAEDFDFDFDCTCTGTICYGECREEQQAPAMDISNLPAMGANNLPATAAHSHAAMGVNMAPAVAVHNLPVMGLPVVPVVAVHQAPDRRYLPGLGMNGPRDQTEEVREYFAAMFLRNIPRRTAEWNAGVSDNIQIEAIRQSMLILEPEDAGRPMNWEFFLQACIFRLGYLRGHDRHSTLFSLVILTICSIALVHGCRLNTVFATVRAVLLLSGGDGNDLTERQLMRVLQGNVAGIALLERMNSYIGGKAYELPIHDRDIIFMFSTINIDSVEFILRGLIGVPTPTGPMTRLNSCHLHIPRLAYDVLGREAFGWSMEHVQSSLRMDWFVFIQAYFEIGPIVSP